MRPSFLKKFDTMKSGRAGAIPSFSHGPHSKQEDLSYSFLTSWRGGFIYLCCTVRSSNFINMEKSCLLCHMSGFVFRFAVFFPLKSLGC